MRTFITTTLIMAVVGAAGSAYAESPTGGSNATGSEKVCFFSANNQNEAALEETLKKCQRGDILDIGWLPTPTALQLCDFTKTVVYHPTKGSIIACVYTGNRRPVSK